MKKLIITTLLAGALAGSAFAQGTVSLQASGSHGLIAYNTGGTTTSVPTGSPAQVSTYGNLDLAVYYASVGTSDPLTATTASSLTGAGWTESANVLSTISPVAGNTLLTTFTLGNATGGNNVEAMVVGWTGSYSSFDAALTAGAGLLGWTGSTLSLGSLDWVNGTGNPNGTPSTTPVALTYGSGGFQGLVLTPIPEPASFALVGLGAATLLIFRRRK